jgi:voltage-gated potassium channel
MTTLLSNRFFPRYSGAQMIEESQTKTPLQKAARGAGLGHYGWLLLALVCTVFFAPMLQDYRIGVRVADLISALVMVAGVFSAITKRVHILMLAGIALLAISARFVDPFVDTTLTALIAEALSFLFLLSVFAIILRDVFRTPDVSTDTLVGSVCGYLILSTIFASIYVFLVILHPDSFMINAGLGLGQAALGDEASHYGLTNYFSIVTLTTVGFGDIVPQNSYARTVVSIEAISGQIYMTVIVARLVGLHLSRSIRG